MSLRNRLRAVAEKAGFGRTMVIPVFLSGSRDEERSKARVEAAFQRGAQIRVVRFCVGERASSIDEALAVIEAHKEKRGEASGIVVHGPNDMTEVLARWDPPAPAWLEELRAKYQR